MDKRSKRAQQFFSEIGFWRPFNNTVSPFANWLTKLDEYCARKLTSDPRMRHYFTNAFGNFDTMTFGPENELSFVIFLVLYIRDLLRPYNRYPKGLFLDFYQAYIHRSRWHVRCFNLKPTMLPRELGLDDLFLLHYAIGAQQMLHFPFYVTPDTVLKNFVEEKGSKNNFYINAVNYAYSRKKGKLMEKMPLLRKISALQDWTDVRDGFWRLYKGEVLENMQVLSKLYLFDK